MDCFMNLIDLHYLILVIIHLILINLNILSKFRWIFKVFLINYKSHIINKHIKLDISRHQDFYIIKFQILFFYFPILNIYITFTYP
jgi:hypothetical protein